MVSTPSTLMAAKVARHPAAVPSQVPSGTPTRLAMARPLNMKATALERRSGLTSSAATTAPMPKNAPWVKEVMTRPPSRTAKLGVRADSTLPAVNTSMSSISIRLRDNRVPSIVMRGARRCNRDGRRRADEPG